jgi:hypothetical protein
MFSDTTFDSPLSHAGHGLRVAAKPESFKMALSQPL